MKNYTAKKPYALAIPETLFEEWGWFENRGYLPPLPGEVWREMELVEGSEEPFMICFLGEGDALVFREQWWALGEARGTCVADLEHILKFLEGIV